MDRAELRREMRIDEERQAAEALAEYRRIVNAQADIEMGDPHAEKFTKDQAKRILTAADKSPDDFDGDVLRAKRRRELRAQLAEEAALKAERHEATHALKELDEAFESYQARYARDRARLAARVDHASQSINSLQRLREELLSLCDDDSLISTEREIKAARRATDETVARLERQLIDDEGALRSAQADAARREGPDRREAEEDVRTVAERTDKTRARLAAARERQAALEAELQRIREQKLGA